jgi:hypothetical protein
MQELVGQTLGQYQIVEPLGTGGMATVFKAFHPALERYVAIKVLPPYYAHEPGFAERFAREARAVAQLEHPHILPVYDSGQEGGYSYIVMKYVPAGTLKEQVSAGTLSLEQIVDVLCQIAEALDCAHQHGIIHRDVKPSNVLMDQGRWALLTDFGLARMVEGSAQLTASGVGVGTPAYMAPEQGKGAKVDARADVYSLGILLFEMLTGRVPFDAETPMAVVVKHITDRLPMPRSLDPTIPELVEGVVLRALAKEPDDRYASAGALAAALQDAVRATTAWPDLEPAPFEPPPMPAEALSLPSEPVMAEEAGTRETTEVLPRRTLPWWAWAVGALSLLILSVFVLMATGVLDPFGTDGPETEPLVQLIPPTGIVVDNLDPGFTVQEGDWGTCENGYCEGTCHGTDFRYAEPGCISCQARFDVEVSTAGEYDVWTWWPRGEDRATDTPYIIEHGEVALTVHVNQRREGSAWLQLATLDLEQGEPVQILVGGSESGYANADAVALTPAGSWSPGMTQSPASSAAIVVDNVDRGFSIETGDWGVDDDDNAYGADFRYADPDCASCRARFEVPVTDAGGYDVWTWWPQGDDRSTDTPFTLVYSGGTAVVRVDQRHAGTAWVRLATLSLQAGETLQVIVQGSESDSGYANADAVALTPAGSGRPE